MKQGSFIICLALAACKPSPHQERVMELQALEADTLAHEELHNSDYGIYFFDYPVTERIIYSLQLHYPDRKARIYPQRSGPVIQEMDLSNDIDLEAGYYLEEPQALFAIQDVNFDGYADISFLRSLGVANGWSDYHLFDPATKRWRHHEELSDYPNITLDEKDQTLSFYNKGGFGGAWYESGLLDWQNGKPVLIRKEEQTSDGENTEVFIRTIWVYSDGALKVASKVRISEIDNGERQCLLEGEWDEFDRTPFLIFANSDAQVTRVDGRKSGCK